MGGLKFLHESNFAGDTVSSWKRVFFWVLSVFVLLSNFGADTCMNSKAKSG